MATPQTTLPSPRPTLASTLARGAADVGGGVLAATTQVLASIRTAAKPLHPSGEVYTGRLARRGANGPRTGAAWLDEPGRDDVVVRLSRAVGLPDGVPDVHGLALRVLAGEVAEDGPADILFATTGTARVLRHLLTVSRHPRARPMTTLLPYRTPSGPVLLRVDASDPDSYEMSWARPSGGWRRFATLELDEHLDDPHVSFDPVLHRAPGLAQYPWVVRLREPSYRRARRSRDES